jgi:queuosine precursor transporter
VNSSALVVLYLAAVVAANLLVARLGPQATIITAFLLIGLDITARDRLHDAWQGRRLWLKMAGLIAAGSLLSWLLNRSAGPVALASFVAFATSSTADTLAYHLLRRKAWAVKVNGSNVVSAAIDSLVFPTLAFGMLLPFVVLGQFAAKVAGGALWAAVLRARRGVDG